MTAEIIPFNIACQDDGELRISDVELSDHLEYPDVKQFRRLTRAHLENLNEINQVHSMHLDRTQGGGRKSRAYWFTEAQALFMISRSDRPAATRLMVSVSVAFVAMRRALADRSIPYTRATAGPMILSPAVQAWEKKFERPFFVNLHRVLGLKQPERNNHPNCGHFINTYVYKFLFGEVGLEVIRDANPKVLRFVDDGSAEYHRAYRHHQMLKAEHDPAFKQHIRTLNTLLGVANSLSHFDDIFNATFPQRLTQIGFIFNERQRMLSRTPEKSA